MTRTFWLILMPLGFVFLIPSVSALAVPVSRVSQEIQRPDLRGQPDFGGRQVIQVQRTVAGYSGLGQNGGAGMSEAGFTLKQLLHKLEGHFPTLLSGEGRLGLNDETRSDRLLSRDNDTYLETLGPPDSLEGLLYSYAPGTKTGSQKKRVWAGILVRNALPRWRGGRAWVRRALFQLEENHGAAPFRKEVEGHSVVISHEHEADVSNRRVAMKITPLRVATVRPDTLRISQRQLLNGLGSAFPERLEGQGDLFHGPETPNDKFFSANNFATLSTLGPEDDLLAIQYNYQLRDDHKSAWDENRQYALELVINLFPRWPEASEWLRNAIVIVELERGHEEKAIVRNGIALRVLHYNNNISVTVAPEDLQF